MTKTSWYWLCGYSGGPETSIFTYVLRQFYVRIALVITTYLAKRRVNLCSKHLQQDTLYSAHHAGDNRHHTKQELSADTLFSFLWNLHDHVEWHTMYRNLKRKFDVITLPIWSSKIKINLCVFLQNLTESLDNTVKVRHWDHSEIRPLRYHKTSFCHS